MKQSVVMVSLCALALAPHAEAGAFVVNGGAHGFVSSTGFVQTGGESGALDEGWMWTQETTDALGADPGLFDDLLNSTFFAPTSGSDRPSTSNMPAMTDLGGLFNIPFPNAPAGEVGFGWISFPDLTFAPSAPGSVDGSVGEFVWMGQLVVESGSVVDVPRGRSTDSNQFLVVPDGGNPLLPGITYEYSQSLISFTADGSYDIEITPAGADTLYFSVLRDGQTLLGDDRYSVYLSDTRVLTQGSIVRTALVPAPGAGALLGVALLGATRRRR